MSSRTRFGAVTDLTSEQRQALSDVRVTIERAHRTLGEALKHGGRSVHHLVYNHLGSALARLETLREFESPAGVCPKCGAQLKPGFSLTEDDAIVLQCPACNA